MRIPLQLCNRPHWELKGTWDAALFFRYLLALFPDATTVFIEGTSVAQDVAAFMISAAESGDYLPARQTIWPRPKQYRLRCDGTTLANLADLAERHAEPELLDHLFVYNSLNVLMEFPDAFAVDCPAFISSDANEQRVRTFAETLQVDLSDARQSQHR